MGVSCCSTEDTINIDNFNKNYIEKNYDNTKIEVSMKNCKLHDIGQEGFKYFCSLHLKYIEILNLSNNNIEDITVLENFRAPKLKNLDLSYNSIKDINIFKEINYPLLEELDLRYNLIIDISIFKTDNIFPKLTKLYLNNNYFDSNDKENEDIMIHLNERMKKNFENSDLKYGNNDNNYKNVLKNIKTLKDKFIIDDDKNKINIFDKNAINKIETLKTNQNEDKEVQAQFDEIIKNIKTLKISSENVQNSVNSFIIYKDD